MINLLGLNEHLDELEWIFSKIGTNSGFEEIIQLLNLLL